MDRETVVSMTTIFQALYMVDSLARGGRVSAESMQFLRNALVNTSPDSIEELLPNETLIQDGAIAFRSVLSGQLGERERTIMTYVQGILRIGRALERNSSVIEKVGKRLENLTSVDEALDKMGSIEAVDNALAAIYREDISPLAQQILVRGEGGHLSREAVAARIRTLLFIAIRYYWIWRQSGGRKTDLMFKRRQINEMLESIIGARA